MAEMEEENRFEGDSNGRSSSIDRQEADGSRIKQLEFPSDRCDVERGEIECPPLLLEHESSPKGAKMGGE